MGAERRWGHTPSSHLTQAVDPGHKLSTDHMFVLFKARGLPLLSLAFDFEIILNLWKSCRSSRQLPQYPLLIHQFKFFLYILVFSLCFSSFSVSLLTAPRPPPHTIFLRDLRQLLQHGPSASKGVLPKNQ